MSASIFISYASQDSKVANTLCKALESRGFRCWIASRDIAPGENFQISIVRAIRGAKIMLLVFTGNSNNSDEMAKELALASQSKLIVVPLRIEDVKQNDAFAYEFATRQWIDFFADWETAIEQLAQRIAVALGVEAVPVHAPVAAAAEAPTPDKPQGRAPGDPAPTPQTVAAAFAAPGVLEAASKPAPDAAGKTEMLPPGGPASAPAVAAPDPGPSSLTTAAAKRGTPVALFVALGVLVVALIGGAAVVLPSFLAKKPAPPAATNAAVAAMPPPIVSAAPPAVMVPPQTSGPIAMAPPPPPTARSAAASPIEPAATGASSPAAEDVDVDPDTQGQAAQRHGRAAPRRHGGGESGGSVEVPF